MTERDYAAWAADLRDKYGIAAPIDATEDVNDDCAD